jgi:hypothetical protein
MYIDPAFGGMLLQVIIAIAAVSGAVIFSFRRKISALFKKKNKGGDCCGGAKDKGQARNNKTDAEDVVDTLSND